MASKKKNSKTVSAKQELQAAVKKLRAQLGAAQKSAEKWKSRAKTHRSDAEGAKAELTAVRRRLDKAAASAAKWKGRAKTPTPSPPAQPTTADAPADVATGAPDDSWTVTRLRAEARSRGLTGYSRKTKAELLAELRG